MIVAAGLLVLVGLGLFVAGLLTGIALLYWFCVAACGVASVLLFVARRRMTIGQDRQPPAPATGATAAPVGIAGATMAEDFPGPAAAAPAAGPEHQADDPPVEQVEFTDLLLVVDLEDEVLVIDEHPRYHLADCAHLAGRPSIPLPVDEARTDGFTPCALCTPDRRLAARARARQERPGA